MARAKRPEPSTIGVTQAPEGVLVEWPGIDPDSSLVEEARLDAAELDGAKLRGLRMVDVEAERISTANGDPLQLMELSPLIAHELGIVVDEA
ncbi:MAG TPA: hypothetical protein VH275_03405 [Solirubrobacterales bacterium]|jgi:hypothetical protein|nr:hypothetical protein [Solirubrobacterales bacterium]